MSITLWTFKDQASGTVRITPNDPVAAMGARVEVSVALPGGFSLRDFRRNLESVTATLTGQSGEEVYLRLTLGDLSADALLALMTPPTDPAT